MVKVIEFIVDLAVVFGILALVSWGVSAGIEFVFGYEIGFWRTLVGILLVYFASNLIFSPLTPCNRRCGKE